MGKFLYERRCSGLYNSDTEEERAGIMVRKNAGQIQFKMLLTSFPKGGHK